MKALVLVGGFGTRLRPVTYAVPKQLIPIAGKPVLFHVLDLLPEEVDEVVLAAGYKAEVVDRYMREHPFRVPVRCVAEAEPLGTGGGMRNAGNGLSDPFLLANSDVISDIDVRALLAFHRSKGAFGTMTLTEVEDTRPYGVAALNSDDRIRDFIEKPEPSAAPSRWINAGISAWSHAVLDAIPPGRPVSFEREVLPGLIPRGVFGFRATGFWEDAGTPERLLRAQRLLFDAGRGTGSGVPAGARGRGPVAAGEGVSARGASFGPYVTLAEGARVDAGAHVENSIVMAGAHVEGEAYVTGSLVGPRARVLKGHRLTNQVLGEAAEA